MHRVQWPRPGGVRRDADDVLGRMSSSPKGRRIAALQPCTRRETERFIRNRTRMSEIRRQWWRLTSFSPRACRGCGNDYTPTAPQQRYCSPECKRDSRVAVSYGLTLAELQTLIEQQEHVCALCGSTGRGYTRGIKLHVDHCHRTGRGRGLLCGDCNTALGRFRDDPDRLRAAAAYLERGDGNAARA